jgi:2-polyprenyl-3-methyl-5-hydroxy-6-metoxy-1,4-benzoquinol methylase
MEVLTMSVKNRVFERKPYSRSKAQISILPASAYFKSAFPNWITEYCTPDAFVLDIGAGKDRNQIDATIQPHVLSLVGVDASEDILFNSSVHERYNTSLENFAKGTQEKFDILFCTMVLEHITNPYEFFSACRQLLKPGGMFFAVTPNICHYFGLATKITSILKLNEWLLDRLIGKQAKEAYHFPTFYKVNSSRAIRNILSRTGFDNVEFRCFDNWIEYRYVLPKQLHWFPKLYSRLVYRFNLPHLMGRIMFRAIVT